MAQVCHICWCGGINKNNGMYTDELDLQTGLSLATKVWFHQQLINLAVMLFGSDNYWANKIDVLSTSTFFQSISLSYKNC